MRHAIGVLGLLTVLGCQAGEVERLNATVDSLEQVVAELRDQPGWLLGEGLARMEAGEFDAAKTSLEAVTTRYPDAVEAVRARDALDAITARADSIARHQAAIARRDSIERAAAAAARARQAAAREREEAARRRAVERDVVARRDNVENVTWHRAAGSTSWRRFAAYVYVGQRGGHYWPRLYFGTRSGDWIFWRRVIFNVDGRQITFGPYEHFDKDTDVGYGTVRETMDVTPSDYELRQLRQIADGTDVKIRYRGDRSVTYTFGAGDKRRLRTILDFLDYHTD